MLDQRYSNNDDSKRDIPSFIEPLPPLISNPFMRPRPQKGTNLLELFEEDSESEEPELVQVYLRLKPYHARNNLYEVRSDRCLITSVDTATAGHGRRTQHNVSKMYTFSHIFGAEATQKEIFESVVKDNLKKLPDGQNFTLLTYGASGSGKTYTLMGTVASPGLVPRSLEYVFRVVEAAQQPLYKPVDGGSEKIGYAAQDYELQWVKRLRHISAPLRDKYRRMSAGLCNDFTVSSMDLSNRTRHYVWVSFVEIYNEGIYDLLAPGDRRNASKLRIREDASGNVYVKDVTQAFVRSGEEAYDVMVAGKHNLQVAATGIHAQSSRSHCIFTITMLTETEGGVRSACVRLCDLAGCERARRTRNAGARLAESRAINSSLHVLERCLHTLRRRQRRPAPAACVPYRESKLTRLLGAGLSGCRGEAVSMVVTLNPAPEYAHETKHVLQLAAVARDIQVNSTIAESTLESSTQDTTIGSSAEVMRLRADNERLHFELVQAQARNRELSLSMEEKQRAAADTMRELVEEAKDMTRQYYEPQLQALRDEMDEMIEEYESRLAKAPAASLGGLGTPSRALQNKVAQLMTEIAILEEKLTAERLARARAEEEVQHLRACIDERDEKEGTSENVMLLSDEDQDSDEETNDPCNESLEPTFKKEDINKSRMAQLDQCSINSDKSLDDSANDNDRTIGNNDDSVINKSGDTVKDHDNTETTKESVYATGDDDSASTNHTFKSYDNYQKNKDEGVSFESYDEPKDQDCDAGAMKKDSAARGTYFVRSHEDVDDDQDLEKDLNIKKTDSLTRGTYFVSDAQIISKPTVHDDKCKKEDLIDLPTDLPKIKGKVSESLVNKIMKSVKTSHGSNTSLAQFEQLEMAANNCDETRVGSKMSSEFGNLNILKEKKTYFEDPSKDPKMVDKEVPISTTIKEKEAKFKEITRIKPPKILKDLQDLTEVPKLIKDKTKTYFEEPVTEPSSKIAEDLVPVPKLLKEKKTYFDNIDVNIEESTNKKVNEIANEMNLQSDDTRSPSIVKDDVTNDFKASAIKKLLGESFTRPPDIVSSVHKHKIVHKKHDSVDIFEGLDSPVPIRNIADKNDIVEHARKSIEQLVLDQKSASKIKQEIKVEYRTISEEIFEISPVPSAVTEVEVDKQATDKGSSSHRKVPEKHIKDAADIFIQPRVKSPLPRFEANAKSDKINDKVKEYNESQKKLARDDIKNSESQNITVNNTIEDFEKLYKDVSTSRATEFDMLVSQDVNDTNNDEIAEKNAPVEEVKYNLRHKTVKTENVKFSEKVEREEYEEVLLESHAKCESKMRSTKRSLRLRRRKNQADDSSEQEGEKLKDLVNLQEEFSDVTLDVPAPVKQVKDIASPEKVEDENVPPLMGIQSCPSKSVTRSRRKLFTPRAEPLHESPPGDSDDRVRVLRPSYHRARARRRL